MKSMNFYILRKIQSLARTYGRGFFRFYTEGGALQGFMRCQTYLSVFKVSSVY